MSGIVNVYDWVTNLEGIWIYLFIFCALYVSGAGIPVPEEFPLAAGGLMLALGRIGIIPLVLCVGLALMTGDLTAYWLGHRFGMRLVRIPPFRWMLTPDRLEKVKLKFRENEGKTIFFSRFFAGVRLATFVFSGMVHVPIPKFVVLDMLAACLSAPIFVVIGYMLPDLFAALRVARTVNIIIFFVALTAVAITWLVLYLRGRRPTPAPPPGAVTTDD